MSFLRNYRLTTLRLIGITFRFVVTGGLGFVVNYGFLSLFTNQYGFSKLSAEIIATIIALQVTFVLNNYWTYSPISNETKLVLSLPKRYFAFIVSNSMGSFITILVFWILIKVIPSDLGSLLIAAMCGMTWNFFSNLLITWKPGQALQTSPETVD